MRFDPRRDAPFVALETPVPGPRSDPRTVAVVAVLLALGAIALEIAYAIGHFVLTTVHQVQ
jgi:hypothetical protein